MNDVQPIRIKLTIGDIEAEIECGEENLRKTIDTVLSSIQERREELVNLSSRTSEKHISERKTCKGIILELWTEGWFNTSRLLGEVWEEMGRRGYHYDRTAVSHSLAELVRESYLTRLGKPRNYRYVQRKPP
jgi:hypothetical protein